MNKFISEVLIVGICTAIVGLIISTIIMFMTVSKFNLKEYSHWPQVMLSFLFTGMFMHIVFEIAGFNKWYCKNGNACLL